MTLQQVLNFIQQHIGKILILFFAFGLPLIARIHRKLLEVKREREMAMRREREELERLRTGRSAAPSPTLAAPTAPSARASLEEVAEARRRRIEEMRQRQVAGTAGATGVAAR